MSISVHQRVHISTTYAATHNKPKTLWDGSVAPGAWRGGFQVSSFHVFHSILDMVYWLVVEPTHLKNMIVKLGSSSPGRGENIKYLKPPPSLGFIVLGFTCFSLFILVQSETIGFNHGVHLGLGFT